MAVPSAELVAVIGFIALLLVAVVVGGLSSAWLARARDRSARVQRARVAQRGERQARRLLEAAGYHVVEEQARRTWRYEANGRPMQAELFADYLVQRGSSLYVADAKTGRGSTLKNIDTRRQLLEYQLAFEVPAVILLDMDTESLHVVRFFAERA